MRSSGSGRSFDGKKGNRRLGRLPAGSATTIDPAPPGSLRPGVDTGIRLTTDDCEARHRELAGRGVDVDDVLRWPGVPPMFSLRDPDGNTLYIVEGWILQPTVKPNPVPARPVALRCRVGGPFRRRCPGKARIRRPGSAGAWSPMAPLTIRDPLGRVPAHDDRVPVAVAHGGGKRWRQRRP